MELEEKRKDFDLSFSLLFCLLFGFLLRVFSEIGDNKLKFVTLKFVSLVAGVVV